MTKVTVFGGSGFVGRHLSERLVDDGVEVTSVDIAPPKWPVAGVTSVEGDVRHHLDLTEVAVPDRIYNLAAVHRTPGHPEHEYYEANVRGALAILEHARRHDVREIVFTSSISVYGPCEDPTDERSTLKPTSSYGRSKLIAEELHRTWQAEEPGRRLVVIRPAVVFGHGENGNVERLRKALWRRRFVYPGRTDTVKACIYVGELVRSFDFGLAKVRQEGSSGVITYNGAYPERCTITDIVQALHDLDGAPLPRGKVPKGVVLGAAGLLQVAAKVGAPNAFHPDRVRKLLMSTNVVPGTLVEEGYDFSTDMRGGIKAWLDDEQRRGTEPQRR